MLNENVERNCKNLRVGVFSYRRYEFVSDWLRLPTPFRLLVPLIDRTRRRLTFRIRRTFLKKLRGSQRLNSIISSVTYILRLSFLRLRGICHYFDSENLKNCK